jgi:hypothetical protein
MVNDGDVPISLQNEHRAAMTRRARLPPGKHRIVIDHQMSILLGDRETGVVSQEQRD